MCSRFGKLAQSRFHILLIKSSFSSSTTYSIYTCVAIASVAGQLTKVSEEFRNFQLGNRFVLPKILGIDRYISGYLM